MGEATLGCISKGVYCVTVDPLAISINIVHLPSIHADKLKYGQTDAFGYNKCRVSSTLEAALMIKSVNGEKTA